MKANHMESKCPICGKVFTKNYNLNRHVKLMTIIPKNIIVKFVGKITKMKHCTLDMLKLMTKTKTDWRQVKRKRKRESLDTTQNFNQF